MLGTSFLSKHFISENQAFERTATLGTVSYQYSNVNVTESTER